MEGAERLKNMPFSDYLTWFWNAETSEYIQARIDAGKPLSKTYIRDQLRCIKKYAADYSK